MGISTADDGNSPGAGKGQDTNKKKKERKGHHTSPGSRQKTWHLAPFWQDIDVFESITAALKPLQDFTDAPSGETYVSVSYLKPVLHLFKTEVLKSNEGEAKMTQEIKMRVLSYLNDKYTDPETAAHHGYLSGPKVQDH